LKELKVNKNDQMVTFGTRSKRPKMRKIENDLNGDTLLVEKTKNEKIGLLYEII